MAKNGKIYTAYYYLNGDPVGVWKFFNPDGSFRFEFEIQSGTIIRFRIYNGDWGIVETICKQGFSESQVNLFLNFENAIYEQRLFHFGVEKKFNATIVGNEDYKNNWIIEFRKLVFDLCPVAVVFVYDWFTWLPIYEYTFDVESGLQRVVFSFNKQKRIKRKSFYRDGKLIRVDKYKDGNKVSEKYY